MPFGKQLFLCVLGAIALTSCAPANKKEAAAAGFSRQPFGKNEAGDQVELYTLTNSKGVAAAITNYGGIVVSLKVPDRAGNLADVVLGFDDLDNYKAKSPYFGAIVGRYGNRIGNARFTLNGVEHKLAANDGGNSLHGGIKGFDKVLWSAKPLDGGRGVELTYLSKDGEGVFPAIWRQASLTRSMTRTS
jgi:aldose 1-epimerase